MSLPDRPRLGERPAAPTVGGRWRRPWRRLQFLGARGRQRGARAPAPLGWRPERWRRWSRLERERPWGPARVCPDGPMVSNEWLTQRTGSPAPPTGRQGPGRRGDQTGRRVDIEPDWATLCSVRAVDRPAPAPAIGWAVQVASGGHLDEHFRARKGARPIGWRRRRRRGLRRASRRRLRNSETASTLLFVGWLANNPLRTELHCNSDESDADEVVIASETVSRASRLN